MKTYPAPANFSGAKLAARYGLNSMKDFWVSNGLIYVPDGLPDDPPIFEAPDPPAVRQSKFNVGTPDRNPRGFMELARGKFVPYFD